MTALAVLWIAFLVMNLISFILYGVDKRRAKKDQWRIPERDLLGATWLLGGVGAYAGMQLFRHKTKHTVFVISAPVAAVLQLVLMGYATVRLMNIF